MPPYTIMMYKICKDMLLECVPPVCWQCMDDQTEVGIANCVIARNLFQHVLCRDTLQVQPKLP